MIALQRTNPQKYFALVDAAGQQYTQQFKVVDNADILIPDSPDEIAFGQLRAPISTIKSNSYAGSSSRILRDPTGERRNWQFCQRFRGLRSCRPNPSGGSGLIVFLDHNEGDSDAEIKYDRLRVHEEFLTQLGGHLKIANKEIRLLHFLLNKKDLWGGNPKATDLLSWFAEQVRLWERSVRSQVTNSHHSNRVAADVTAAIDVIRRAVS